MNLSDLLDDLCGDDSKISVQSFDNLIEKLNMRPSYNIFLDEDNDVIIDEEWSSPISCDIKANRIYSPSFVNIILLEDRPLVLNQILNIYISQEDYENAAIVRDLIKDFNYY